MHLVDATAAYAMNLIFGIFTISRTLERPAHPIGVVHLFWGAVEWSALLLENPSHIEERT
ncbi:hypothetical protein SAMN04488123_103177 [Natribacillus halophilus]|uniref:Uncharacterized protein n=1 Tax=Natribacillus halophilus TaxID=549003 RepID=A0A1G8LMN2_9BACI|nr:hypothetical protein SAMN04488123_103177 [Natribacillus halophilus]